MCTCHYCNPVNLGALVREAAQALDEDRPGWEKQVNLAVLDMESCRSCILGMVFGDYRTGIRTLAHGNGYLFGAAFSARKAAPFWANEITNRLFPSPVAADIPVDIPELVGV